MKDIEVLYKFVKTNKSFKLIIIMIYSFKNILFENSISLRNPKKKNYEMCDFEFHRLLERKLKNNKIKTLDLMNFLHMYFEEKKCCSCQQQDMKCIGI